MRPLLTGKAIDAAVSTAKEASEQHRVSRRGMLDKPQYTVAINKCGRLGEASLPSCGSLRANGIPRSAPSLQLLLHLRPEMFVATYSPRQLHITLLSAALPPS